MELDSIVAKVIDDLKNHGYSQVTSCKRFMTGAAVEKLYSKTAIESRLCTYSDDPKEVLPDSFYYCIDCSIVPFMEWLTTADIDSDKFHEELRHVAFNDGWNPIEQKEIEQAEVVFRHGWLAPKLETQANEQGFTFGEESSDMQRIENALLEVEHAKLFTSKQMDKAYDKFHKMLVNTIKRIGGHK